MVLHSTSDDNFYDTSVRVFHFPPFIIIRNGTVSDGILYWLFKEISKNWPIRYRILKPLQWDDLLNSAENESVNAVVGDPKPMEHCLNEQFVCSQALESYCTTFIVPKPVLWDDIFFVFLPFLNIYPFLVTYFLIKIVLSLVLRGLFKFKNNILGNMGTMVEMVMVILFATYYCAFLTSYLTSPLVRKEVNVIKDITKYDLILEGTPNITEGQTKFQKSMLSKLKLLDTSVGYSFSNEQRQVLIKDFRYFTWFSTTSDRRIPIIYVKNMSTVILNQLRVIPSGCIRQGYYALLINKNTKRVVLKALNDYILKVQQFGLLKFWQKKVRDLKEYRHVVDNMLESYVVKDEDQIVSIHKLQGAFWLLLSGYSLGFVILVFETLLKRFEGKFTRTTNVFSVARKF